MRYYFILSILATFGLGFSAYSGTRDVLVQCSLEGPVYMGTLDSTGDIVDISSWAPAKVSTCFPSYTVKSGHVIVIDRYAQLRMMPAFKLSFNGVTYESKETQKRMIFFDSSCTQLDGNPSEEHGGDYFNGFVENTAFSEVGLPVGVTLRYEYHSSLLEHMSIASLKKGDTFKCKVVLK